MQYKKKGLLVRTCITVHCLCKAFHYAILTVHKIRETIKQEICSFL